MQIPANLLNSHTKMLNELSGKAEKMYLDAVSQIDFSNIAEAREAVIEMLNELTDVFGLDAGQAGAYYYDAMRAHQTGKILGAEAYNAVDPQNNRDLVQAVMQSVVDTGETDYFNSKIVNYIDTIIKSSAGMTVIKNGLKDPLKPRFARVPMGVETCEFCLMLASRGFEYLTAKSAGMYNHYHANCDCKVVAQFRKDASVENYDPDALYHQWKDIRDEKAKRKAEREKSKTE